MKSETYFVLKTVETRSTSYSVEDSQKTYAASLDTTSLQKALNTWQSQRPGKRLEYSQLLEDGIYGTKVTAFVKFFQRENGLQGTSSVGPKTRALINKNLFACSS